MMIGEEREKGWRRRQRRRFEDGSEVCGVCFVEGREIGGRFRPWKRIENGGKMKNENGEICLGVLYFEWLCKEKGGRWRTGDGKRKNEVRELMI